MKKVKLFQNESLGQIYIEVVESLESFDVESATGFEDEDENENEKDKDSSESLVSKADPEEDQAEDQVEDRGLAGEEESNKQLLN